MSNSNSRITTLQPPRVNMFTEHFKSVRDSKYSRLTKRAQRYAPYPVTRERTNKVRKHRRIHDVSVPPSVAIDSRLKELFFTLKESMIIEDRRDGTYFLARSENPGMDDMFEKFKCEESRMTDNQRRFLGELQELNDGLKSNRIGHYHGSDEGHITRHYGVNNRKIIIDLLKVSGYKSEALDELRELSKLTFTLDHEDWFNIAIQTADLEDKIQNLEPCRTFFSSDLTANTEITSTLPNPTICKPLLRGFRGLIEGGRSGAEPTLKKLIRDSDSYSKNEKHEIIQYKKMYICLKSILEKREGDRSPEEILFLADCLDRGGSYIEAEKRLNLVRTMYINKDIFPQELKPVFALLNHKVLRTSHRKTEAIQYINNEIEPLLKKGQFNDAYELIQKYLSSHDSALLTPFEKDLFDRKKIVAQIKKDPTSAEKLLEKLSDEGNLSFKAKYFNILGNADRAMYYANLNLVLARKNNKKDEIHSALIALARVAEDMKRHTEVEETYHQLFGTEIMKSIFPDFQCETTCSSDDYEPRLIFQFGLALKNIEDSAKAFKVFSWLLNDRNYRHPHLRLALANTALNIGDYKTAYTQGIKEHQDKPTPETISICLWALQAKGDIASTESFKLFSDSSCSPEVCIAILGAVRKSIDNIIENRLSNKKNETLTRDEEKEIEKSLKNALLFADQATRRFPENINLQNVAIRLEHLLICNQIELDKSKLLEKSKQEKSSKENTHQLRKGSDKPPFEKYLNRFIDIIRRFKELSDKVALLPASNETIKLKGGLFAALGHTYKNMSRLCAMNPRYNKQQQQQYADTAKNFFSRADELRGDNIYTERPVTLDYYTKQLKVF